MYRYGLVTYDLSFGAKHAYFIRSVASRDSRPDLLENMPSKREEDIFFCEIDKCSFVPRVWMKVIWLGYNPQGSAPFLIELSSPFQDDLIRIVILGRNDREDDGARRFVSEEDAGKWKPRPHHVRVGRAVAGEPSTVAADIPRFAAI